MSFKSCIYLDTHEKEITILNTILVQIYKLNNKYKKNLHGRESRDDVNTGSELVFD